MGIQTGDVATKTGDAATKTGDVSTKTCDLGTKKKKKEKKRRKKVMQKTHHGYIRGYKRLKKGDNTKKTSEYEDNTRKRVGIGT